MTPMTLYKKIRSSRQVILIELRHALCGSNWVRFRDGDYRRKVSMLANFIVMTGKSALREFMRRREIRKTEKPQAENNNWPAHKIGHSCTIDEGDKVTLLALYSPQGTFTQLQKKIIADYERLGYKVFAILAVDNINLEQRSSPRQCAGIIFIENKFFDFCSWAVAIHRLTDLKRCKEIILTNDSIVSRTTEADLLYSALLSIKGLELDACFMTESKELRLHGQSYFIHLSGAGIHKRILDIFKEEFFFKTKEDLIFNVELNLLSRLRSAGFNVDCLYKAKSKSKNNPTLQGWRLLCRKNFPFVKVSAFGFANHKANDADLEIYVDGEIRDLIADHLSQRYTNKPKPEYYIGEKHHYNDIGALVPPQLYPEVLDINCRELQGNYPINARNMFTCILHAYYIEIAIGLINDIESLRVPCRLIITTDSFEKRDILEKHCINMANINAEFFVYENRGRDILPMLRVARDTSLEDIPILHLHTKRSTHNARLEDWGKYIFDCLAGERSRLLSCIELIKETNVGLIFPEFYHEIKDQLNWGFNYENASYLAHLLGMQISQDDYLAFPAGSMLWTNRVILQKLANCSWSQDDFEMERGQVDGTLAHAFERIFIHLTLALGKEYVQVSPIMRKNDRIEKYNRSSGNQLMFKRVDELRAWGASYVSPRLKAKLKSFLHQNLNLCYDVDTIFDDTTKKFLNILVPTIEVEKIYGGLSTAFRVANLIYEQNDFDGIRILVTTDATSVQAVENLSRYFNASFDLLKPTTPRNVSSFQVCNLYNSTDRVVRVAEKDIYFATAWWTAAIGRIILDNQELRFNTPRKLIYLIQDYECGFYSWGDNYLLARNTYCNQRTIAIINSLSLFNYISQRFEFDEKYLLPFSLHESLKAKLLSLDSDITKYKENIILCYARPSTSRNCFGAIKDAISWWRKNSTIQKEWKVIFVGEAFDINLVSDIPNCECFGKLALVEYADLLTRAKVGISLMVSPHPSYPPLEMASFGVKVITNDYDSKNLSKSNNNIYSLREVSSKTLSELLDRLCGEKRFTLEEYIENTDGNIRLFPEDFSALQ
jgi:lipopolysaccharide biosynthesis protein